MATDHQMWVQFLLGVPYGPLAQWLEHRSHKPMVLGSNPRRSTTYIDRWRNRLAHSADNREVLSSSLSLSTKYGDWDCRKWSPRLHRGKQVGLIPTISTSYLPKWENLIESLYLKMTYI